MKDYMKTALMLKALSDPNRLMVIDILSCGGLCACKILETLKLSQPTLSHHMKILCGAGFVESRKEGKWMHYTLAEDKFTEMYALIRELSSNNAGNCVCKDGIRG